MGTLFFQVNRREAVSNFDTKTVQLAQKLQIRKNIRKLIRIKIIWSDSKKRYNKLQLVSESCCIL